MIHSCRMWLLKTYYKTVIIGWKAWQFVKYSFIFLWRCIANWFRELKLITLGWSSINETPEVLMLYFKSFFVAIAFAHRTTKEDLIATLVRTASSVRLIHYKSYIEHVFDKLDQVKTNNRARGLEMLRHHMVTLGRPAHVIQGEFRHVDEASDVRS